jgi:hypothetical protein
MEGFPQSLDARGHGQGLELQVSSFALLGKNLLTQSAQSKSAEIAEKSFNRKGRKELPRRTKRNDRDHQTMSSGAVVEMT